MLKTKFTYSLLSIRNMLSLSHLDVVNAVTNEHVVTVCKGDPDNIDNYYTNGNGLSYLRSLSKKRIMGGVGLQK